MSGVRPSGPASRYARSTRYCSGTAHLLHHGPEARYSPVSTGLGSAGDRPTSPPLSGASPGCSRAQGRRLRAMADTADTRTLHEAPMVAAPDGSTVGPLCLIRDVGSFAHFQLEPDEVSRAVAHATVEEIWYVVAGSGKMWRRQGDQSSTVLLHPGVCLTIPLGTVFQSGADAGNEPLQVVAATIPPWPVGSPDEARVEIGPWAPSVRQ